MKKIGYLKGYQLDESLDFQKRELKNEGCNIIFKDSFASSKEPVSGFVRLLTRIKSGDCVVIYNFSTLGFSLSQLVDHVIAIHEKGATLYTIEEAIEITTMMPVIDIFKLLKQIKLQINVDRTRPARNNAKIRGLKGGRPEKISDRQTKEIKRLYLEDIPIKAICERLKISRPTLYKYLKR